jgi:hypothetical protein
MNKDRTLKIIGFIFYSLICYEFGSNPAISTDVHNAHNRHCKWEPTALPHKLPALHLLRLPMRLQTSQAKSKSTERFLNFKFKHCSGEFESSHAFECHRRNRRAQGTPCSDESSKTEITFTVRAGMATGILGQHSLARIGESDIK